MPLVRTLASPLRVEIDRIKGSRFVADASPAADEAAAMAIVHGVAHDLADASHHCWAWRIDAERTRSSDDGEPAGTAGEPILRRLIGADLHASVVVVTRWFGGTKLGMGGLVRAYGEAASAVLAEVEIVETPVSTLLDVRLDYGLTAAVQSVLSAHGIVPVNEDYGAEVRLSLSVPIEGVDSLVHDLQERTSGRARVEEA